MATREPGKINTLRDVNLSVNGVTEREGRYMGERALFLESGDMHVTGVRRNNGYVVTEVYSDEGDWEMAPDNSFTKEELRKYATRTFSRWRNNRRNS